MVQPSILVVGSFDTKAQPLRRLIALLGDSGQSVVTVDVGVFSFAGIPVDYTAEAVAARVGEDLERLREAGRAIAVNAMARGAAAIASDLVASGSVGVVVGIGGGNAASIFSIVTEQLPIGTPKLLMSTVVAGDTRPIVNASDVTMMYPIVDIEGDNGVLESMIQRLAAVATALAATKPFVLEGGRNAVGITMFGVTTPCVAQTRVLLEDRGIESFVFHANGSGGRSFEKFIAQGLVNAVLDVTTTELADEMFGGQLPAGPDRLRTAAEAGVPQVVVPGAIDMINFGHIDTVPEEYRERPIIKHNDLVTLVRTTADENRQMGAEIGRRLGFPAAGATIVIPMRGFSQIDKDGGPFFDPTCVQAFVEGVRGTVSPAVRVIKADLHINDPEFSELLVTTLDELIPALQRQKSRT